MVPYSYALYANYHGGRCKDLDPHVYASCFWLALSIKNLPSIQDSSYLIYTNFYSVFIVLIMIIRYRFKDK